MKARRAQFDKLYQEKTRLEYKKQDYNTVYTALKEFREKNVFDFRMASQLKPMKATAADTSLATITANAEAVPLSHTLEVKSLASAARSQSAASITTGSNKATLASQFQLDPTEPFSITLDDGFKTQTIAVDPNASLYELATSINNSGLNIRSHYDTTLDRFYIYNLQTGSANKLKVTDSEVSIDGESKQFFGEVLGLGALDIAGEDAEIILNGVAVPKQASNMFTVSGLTFDLKQKGATTIDVGTDIDKAIENVKAFVDSYNSIINKINGELNEKYYRDFAPLTTEQKKELKEDEIKAWEEKAKSGMLRSDSMLRGILSDMRLIFAEPVSGINGKYKSAIDLGITTSSYIDEEGKYIDVTSQGGQLSVNEADLRKALTQDPDILYKIFAADGETAKESGVSRRLYDSLKTGLDKIVTTAGRSADLTSDTESTLAKRLVEVNKRISNEQTRLTDLEKRYYSQFDALETALLKLSNQSSWLLQQFSGD
jgi:flagellar hook-associated protein 2